MVKLILLAALVAWFILGDPKNNIANAIWTDSNAPWEKVDGYYYPDKNSTAKFERSPAKVTSSGDCKDWAKLMAKSYRDPQFGIGSYQCGIGEIKKKDGSETYRLLLPK